MLYYQSNSQFHSLDRSSSSPGVRAALLPVGRGAAVGAAGGEDAPGGRPGRAAPDPGGPDAQLYGRLRRVDHARGRGSNWPSDWIPGRQAVMLHTV